MPIFDYGKIPKYFSGWLKEDSMDPMCNPEDIEPLNIIMLQFHRKIMAPMPKYWDYLKELKSYCLRWYRQ